MQYILSLIPIIIYMMVLKLMDSFSLISVRVFAAVVVSGMASCGIAYSLTYVIDGGGGLMLFPCIEEVLKVLPILLLIGRRKVAFVAEAQAYGAGAGAGFALLENVIYLHFAPDMDMLAVMVRGLGTTLMHAGCTALFATLVHLTVLHTKGVRVVMILASLVMPVAIHGVHNMFLLPPVLQMIVVMVFFLIVFYAINIYNERRIYQWLDHSLTFDAQLLIAIKEGRLTDTNTGRYLLTMKEHFTPEVFFDIICYLQLYLELIIKSKSRLLLVEEGLAEPFTEEEKLAHRAQVTELYTLHKNIGIAGQRILRPIITLSDADKKILKEG